MEQAIEQIEQTIPAPHHTEHASENEYVIENTPPFFDHIKPFLNQPLSEIEKRSHRFDEAYLSWQAVRYMGGKDKQLTGFEPYFIGDVEDKSMITRNIESIGAQTLRILDKKPLFKSRVIQTLTEQKIHLDALLWLYETLGSITAQLRAQCLQNNKARYFRDTTHQRIATYPKIEYMGLASDHTVQRYRIPRLSSDIPIEPIQEKNSNGKITPLEFMALLGKAGHPLFRASINALDPEYTSYLRNKEENW